MTRDVSRQVLEMSLSGGSVRRARREVRLAMLDVWGVLVRLMTMGRMSSIRLVLTNGIGEGGIFVGVRKTHPTVTKDNSKIQRTTVKVLMNCDIGMGR
jgi:hypothetical protein